MPPITSPAAGSDTLPREVSDLIFERAEAGSAIQQLALNEPLPSNGAAIPTITGDPVAAWVAEGGRKPVSDASTGVKLMDPKKLSVIVAFSDEFLRTDRTNLPDRLRDKIATAFGQAFDRATVHDDATAGPFTNYIAETTNDVELGTATTADGGIHADLISGMRQVVADGYTLTGFAASPLVEPDLLDARDTTGRPLLSSGVNASGQQTLLGRGIVYGKGVGTAPSATPTATDGIRMVAGDWGQAAWGAFGEIEYDVSREATLVDTNGTDLLHLWQNNLVAIRAEAFYGWVLNDPSAFVKFRDNA